MGARNGLSFGQRLKLVEYLRSHAEDLHNRTWPERAALAEAVVQFPVTGANLKGVLEDSGVVLRDKNRVGTVQARLDELETLVATLEARVATLERLTPLGMTPFRLENANG